MKQKMADNKEMAELSYTLATIKCDVELPFEPQELKNGEADKEKLREWFTKLEFKTWLSDLDKAPSVETASDTVGNASSEQNGQVETPVKSDLTTTPS